MNKRMSVKEAAEALEVTPAIIRMMCKTGQLGKVVKDGKKSIFLIYQKQVESIKKDPVGAGSGYEVPLGTSDTESGKDRIPQFLRKDKR